MKRLSTLLTFASVTVCGVALFTSSAMGQSNAQALARTVFESNSPKIFGVKALVEIEASVQGQQAMRRERSVYGNGTVIADGILLCSYRSIRPKATANTRAPAGLSLKTNVKEIQLVDESGEEFDAKLVLHDEDLDIAFIALDRESENAESWSADPIDISPDVELDHLDEAVIISRTGEALKFQPTVRLAQVSTIVPRPRRLYSLTSSVLGSAVFNLEGQFVGLSIRKTSGSGSEFNAVLPSKYIRKLLPQAIEKAANGESEESLDDESEGEDQEIEEDTAEDDKQVEDANKSKDGDGN